MRTCVLMLALGVSRVMAVEPVTNLTMLVKGELDALYRDIPSHQTDIRYLREEGVCFRSNDHFKAIATILSNGWRDVWWNLPDISSNANDRLIVLAASIKPSESDFLSKLDILADLVLSNKVSQSEFKWYWSEYAIVDHFSGSAMVRRYAESSVSNLIMKVQAAGCFPRGVRDIFNGEAKEFYEDAVHDGLIGP